jgi:hypothetical protein
MSFWFISVVSKYLNVATLSNDSLATLTFWFCPEFEWRRESDFNMLSLRWYKGTGHEFYKQCQSVQWLGYGSDNPNSISSGVMKGLSLLAAVSRPALGSHPTSYPMDARGFFFPGLRCLVHPSSTQFKNAWNYTTPHPCLFIAWCLIKERILCNVVGLI